jgi:hypothetical protein
LFHMLCEETALLFHDVKLHGALLNREIVNKIDKYFMCYRVK